MHRSPPHSPRDAPLSPRDVPVSPRDTPRRRNVPPSPRGGTFDYSSPSSAHSVPPSPRTPRRPPDSPRASTLPAVREHHPPARKVFFARKALPCAAFLGLVLLASKSTMLWRENTMIQQDIAASAQPGSPAVAVAIAPDADMNHGTDSAVDLIADAGSTGSTSSTSASPTAAASSTAAATSALLARARPLPRTAATATAASIVEAAQARLPVLWTASASPSAAWRAHAKWDVEALSALVPWAVARLDEHDGEFVLTAAQRGGDQPLLHGAPPWEPLRPPTRNMSIASILSDGEQHRPNHQRRLQHYYYSGSLAEESTKHWKTEAVMADLAPLDALRLADAPPLTDADVGSSQSVPSSRPVNRTSLRLWLTSGNVLARAHYDKSHNVLCVVRGRKQVALWPPEEVPSLHLYPAIHAAHRQSQVSLTRLDGPRAALQAGGSSGEAGAQQRTGLEGTGLSDDAAAATHSGFHGRAAPSLSGVVGEFALLEPEALLGARGAWGAEVGPGECLYTPPYWAHSVYSPEPSVALAAFSTSWEQARWARSGWLLAPLGRFARGGVCSRARGAALLISAFVHACAPVLYASGGGGGGGGGGGASGASAGSYSPLSPRAFLARVFASRFAPLYGALHEPSAAAAGPSADALSDCLAAPPSDGEANAPELDPQLRQRIRTFAASVAALLTEPDASAIGGPRRFTPGVAAELAADYVEELAGWACGADGAWRLLRLLALTEETDVRPGVHEEL